MENKFETYFTTPRPHAPNRFKNLSFWDRVKEIKKFAVKNQLREFYYDLGFIAKREKYFNPNLALKILKLIAYFQREERRRCYYKLIVQYFNSCFNSRYSPETITRTIRTLVKYGILVKTRERPALFELKEVVG